MPHKITLDTETLELLGLKQKEMVVYEALLRLGTAPLRRIAEESNLNRGTTYDALKRLINLGLADHVDAKKHRYFSSADPQKLHGLATRREVAIQEARENILKAIPELQAIAQSAHHRPTVRYFEGDAGVKDILHDVLATTELADSKLYRVYSSSDVRDLIAAAWPTYNKERLRRTVSVRAIAIGDGGETHGLDERRWLGAKHPSPTYIFIYHGKTAYVSLDAKKNIFGVIIYDAAVSQTQELIFDHLWNILPRP